MSKRKVISISILAALIVFSSTAASAGTVTGTITYDGKVPKFKEIKMDADPICLSKHREKVLPQTLVLGPDKTMGNVFVRVKDGIFDNPFPVPVEPVIMTQEGCMYDPHVIGIMAGQPLKTINAAKIEIDITFRLLMIDPSFGNLIDSLAKT